MKRFLSVLLAGAAICLFSGSVFAASSVSWMSPPNNSSFPVGTIVNPSGQASGTGTIGGTGLDLALVIDVSGSMWGPKLAAAKNAAVALVNALPQNTTSVAVIRFSSSASTARVLTALNPSKAAVIAAINGLSAGGGTYIGNGISLATSELTSSRHTALRTQMQVVLSDGYSGGSPPAAAAAAHLAGITVHSVGMQGHNVSQMQAITAAGGGVYTNSGSLANLIALFNGTTGSLVGLDYVDIELPDGTMILDVATDALGNFALPDWAIELGINTFTATAYGTDGTSASAVLNLNGTIVPEPSTYLLMGIGLAGLAWARRRKKV